MKFLLFFVLLSALLPLSCMKHFTTTAGAEMDTTKTRIIRIDTTRMGPEIFLEIYYRDKK